MLMEEDRSWYGGALLRAGVLDVRCVIPAVMLHVDVSLNLHKPSRERQQPLQDYGQINRSRPTVGQVPIPGEYWRIYGVGKDQATVSVPLTPQASYHSTTKRGCSR